MTGLPMPVAVAIWVTVGLVLLVTIVIGFNRRSRDDSGEITSVDPIPDPDQLGAALCAPIEAIYVSTTHSGDWLARVGALGLGNRSSAVVQVFESGLTLRRTGEQDLFIGADRLIAHSTSSGIAGKYTPHDGLDIVTWQPRGSTFAADSGLRVVSKEDRHAFQEALKNLIASNTVTLEENS